MLANWEDLKPDWPCWLPPDHYPDGFGVDDPLPDDEIIDPRKNYPKEPYD